MTAIVTTADGKLEVATVPRPTPLASEVLIKTAAVGVNPVDWKTKASKSPARARFPDDRPMILGWDVAGTMESGQLTVEVAETRPLAQMAELHAIGEAGVPFGKLVATVD